MWYSFLMEPQHTVTLQQRLVHLFAFVRHLIQIVCLYVNVRAITHHNIVNLVLVDTGLLSKDIYLPALLPVALVLFVT